MAYVAVGFLLLLIIGGFLTFLIFNATRRSNVSGPPFATDEAPAGDTVEHSENLEQQGTGTDHPRPHEPAAGRFKRDPIGGEGEGETATGADVAHPDQSAH